MTWLAIAFALLSAATVGFSTSLQHRSAEHARPSASGAVGLMRQLARMPWWWVGQALGFVALVWHALALHYGPIALVQPIVITSIVFAVLIRSAMSRTLPPGAELVAVVVIAGGLALFLVASAPQQGDVAARPGLQLSLTLSLALVAAVVIGLASRVRDGHYRAFLLGVGAGLLFGLVAVSLKVSLHDLDTGGVPGMATSWATWAFIVLGLSGVAANQLAYSSGRISASMPVLNMVDVLVAVAFGYVVFEEAFRTGAVALAVQGLALASVIVGLWQVARFEDEQLAADRAQARRPRRVPERW